MHVFHRSAPFDSTVFQFHTTTLILFSLCAILVYTLYSNTLYSLQILFAHISLHFSIPHINFSKL